MHTCIAQGESALDDQIARLLRQLHLRDYVHMAGLWENVWDVYPAFDILASTSRSEGMPLALLEGMACGRPIVAMVVERAEELFDLKRSVNLTCSLFQRVVSAQRATPLYLTSSTARIDRNPLEVNEPTAISLAFACPA